MATLRELIGLCRILAKEGIPDVAAFMEVVECQQRLVHPYIINQSKLCRIVRAGLAADHLGRRLL